MIVEIKIRHCPKCGSTDIIKNGHDYKGAQKHHCKACGAYGTLDKKRASAEAQQEQALDAYFERVSMRGIERVFSVSRYYLARWLLETAARLPPLSATLVKWQPGDILELDELWSFVLKKSQKRWVWLALCRRTRQIVAYVIGDRSEETCRQLWERIPTEYKACHTFSDFWDAYRKVFPKTTHQSVSKESGQTNHIERWNNTLRQRLSRFVRKTLSFSKSDHFHEAALRLFIHRYNQLRVQTISQF
jgi:insertion element IS1 protein InsB